MARSIEEKIKEAAKSGDQLNYENNQSKPKLKIEDFDVRKVPNRDRFDIIEKSTGNVVGNFPYRNARIKDADVLGTESVGDGFKHVRPATIPGHITMDVPLLDDELVGRGLGQQVYPIVEKQTGMKIMPDTSLSESSFPLHEKYGLGKKFGSDDYGPSIKAGVKDEVELLQSLGKLPKNVSPAELAEQAYETIKAKMHKRGLTSFKALGPLMLKGTAAAATGGLALGAQAAEEAFDSPEAGDVAGQNAYERDIAADKQQKRIEKSSSVPDEVKLKALELFKKNRLPY